MHARIGWGELLDCTASALCRAQGSRQRRPYEDVSVGATKCTGHLDASDRPKLGAISQVWWHVAYRFVWGTGVFQRQSGARSRGAGVLYLDQSLQLPADTHAAAGAQNCAGLG